MSGGTIEWAVSRGLVGYEAALAAMEERVHRIARGEAPELIWLLEHPALYTAGTSAKADDIRAASSLPVHAAGRGGAVTYHGPGQRIGYVMLDLKRRSGGDVHAFIRALESWIIAALKRLGVDGVTIAGQTGVWVGAGDDVAKIAAIGLRVRHGISFHGIAINADPDLSHFAGIVPCGLDGSSVTSLAALERPTTLGQLDDALKAAFAAQFGVRAATAQPPIAGSAHH